MQLKRLIIQGFKSFKDRTVIHFNKGITGIVGPNGCGKSNIVDAIFWVMGEQSAKHLRGQTMKDLIFAGSDKYGPGTWAEVSLILGNEERKYIHINSRVVDPSEIQLTRKLYRNGETEYRINDTSCRLKDIQEVFMDTGAGVKSYSVIAQGEIDRLVQAKPPERRAMIEEVAGITKFKARKKESLRKIEQAQNNLSRLIDLKMEVKKSLDSLKDQAYKASCAKELKEQIKKDELIVKAHRELDILDNYRNDKILFDDKRLEIEKWQISKNGLELEVENKNTQRMDLSQQAELLQKEYNELSKQLAAMEERQDHLSFNRTEKQSFIDSRQRESEESTRELENRKERLEKLKKEQESFENEKNTNSGYVQISGKVDSLKEQYLKSEQEYKNIKIEIEKDKEQLGQTETSIEKISSRMEESLLGLEDTIQEISSLESQYAETVEKIKKEKENIQTMKDDQEKLLNEEKESSLNVNDLKVQKEKIDSEYHEKLKEAIRIESLLKSLEELNHSLEGVGEGTSDFLKSNESVDHQILGNMVQCEGHFAPAAQRLLESIMDVLIDENKNHNNFFSWRKGRIQQRTELLGNVQREASLTQEELKSLQEKLGSGTLTPLEQVVSVKKELGEQIIPLLQGLYIADELDTQKLVDITVDTNFKMIASLSGKVLIKKNGKALIIGLFGEHDGQGLIERNNKIAELNIQLKEIREKVDVMATKKMNISWNLQKAQENNDEVLRKKTQVMADYKANKAALDTKDTAFSSGISRLEVLKKKRENILKSREDMIAQKEQLKSLRVGQQIQIDSKQKEFIEYNKNIESLQATYHWEREAMLEKKMEERGLNERFDALSSQIEDIEKQIEKEEYRLKTNLNLMEQYRNDIANISEELIKIIENNKNLRVLSEEKRQIISEKKNKMNNLNNDIENQENEYKELTAKVNKTEKKLVQIEGKIGRYIEDEEQLVKDVFEKYQINLRHCLAGYLNIKNEELGEFWDINSLYLVESQDRQKQIEENSYQFVRMHGKELKDSEKSFEKARVEYIALGDINWQAIKDYDVQKSRFDFLSRQEEELHCSVKDLEKAINHIDEKSKERFKIAFSEVQNRFERVFPIIFGGGNAKLKIIGDMDDPECGVDIAAQPPGKRMQGIDLLSGGEKALTAVSLIFSIFLVKPSPFCLLDEVDAPLDDANVGRFNELLREIGKDSQFILITHNKRTMELNDTLYGVTMQEPGISKAVSVHMQQ